MAQCKEQLSGKSQSGPRTEALSWKGSELPIMGGMSRTKERQKNQRRHSGLDSVTFGGCYTPSSACFSNSCVWKWFCLLAFPSCHLTLSLPFT